MVEIFFLCARRADLSHLAYSAHLLERHAPLALQHHPRLRGYTVYDVEEALPPAEPIDSVNALAFDSLQDYERGLYASVEGERLVSEDHARFLGGASGYAGHLRVLHDSGPAPAHWLCALRRRAGLDAQRFSAELVPELLAGQPAATRVALLEVERRLFPDAAPEWDAFLCLGFADAARRPVHPFASPDCAMSLRKAAAALCAASALWRAQAHVLRRAG
ncbi:MAG TPA: EthD domain-containing protein [Myxococcota bacterium]|nr:EthD domain-containing protein [Myxococcota bacterium]